MSGWVYMTRLAAAQSAAKAKPVAGPCPLCRVVDGTRRIHGTDRRVCQPCADNIPTNMHMPEVGA